MNNVKVLMLTGKERLLNDAEGIELISKDLLYEEILAEIHATDATHIIIHEAYLYGGPYLTRLEQLRKANAQIAILIITQDKKQDASAQKAYADNHIVYLHETVSGLSDKVMRFIKDTTDKLSEVKSAAPTDVQAINEPCKAPVTSVERPAKITPSEIQQSQSRKNEPGASEHKLRPPSQAVIIPVFSGNRGAGCTWLCVQMASYLTSLGMNCAVTGCKDIMYFSPKGELTKFEKNGIDLYAQTDVPELLNAGYDYILLDIGQIMSMDADKTARAIAASELIKECRLAPHKYMITDYMLGRGLALDEIMNNPAWRSIAANCTVLLSQIRIKSVPLKRIWQYCFPLSFPIIWERV